MLSTYILALGTLGTLIAAGLVFKTLKSNHDWQRREYATNIVRDWNTNTSWHWQAIETVFPHLRDIDRTSGLVSELTRQQALEIYTCEPSSRAYWELRYHFIELLNYLEFVAVAYIQNVADHEIVESCLQLPMVKYHDMFRNVIDVVENCEGYRPWEPYTQVVGRWKARSVTIRKSTA